MAAPLYTRFIPPKTKRSKESTEGQRDSNPSPQEDDPMTSRRDQLYVRYIPPKSSKQVKSTNGSNGSQPVPSIEDLDRKNEDPAATEPKEKKPKRPKKRKLQDAELEAEKDTDVIYSKRHQVVFAKFQRSSKIAEHLRNQQPIPDEQTVVEKEPTPELHGTRSTPKYKSPID